MSALGEILVKLEAVNTDIQKIDLVKETDLSKISAMATNPIKGIDEVVKRDDFGEDHLKAAVEIFKAASEKAELYDKSKDIEEIKKVATDPTKIKEIDARMKAREEAKKAIQGKYDELSKKQLVIQKYQEKFDPQYFVDKQNDKLEQNNKRIEANKTRISEISDFKNKVSGELGVIKQNIELLEELDKLQKLQKDIEDRENNLTAIKGTLDPDAVKALEEDLNKQKSNLNNSVSELAKKHKGISLDPKNLVASITTVKITAKDNIDKAKKGIEGKVKGAEKKYNYTEGFENYIEEKVTAAKGDDKKFLRLFDAAREELTAENINLNLQNSKIAENVEGMKVLGKGGITGSTNITEEEIEAKIKEDPEIRALAPILTEEEKTQKIYDSLVEGKRSKSPILHPIAFLKSRYGKGTREQWQADYDKEMRNKAIEAIKKERTKKEAAVKVAENKEQAFRKSLFRQVMSASKDEVKQMEENADKAPGEVLVQAYEQADDDGR